MPTSNKTRDNPVGISADIESFFFAEHRILHNIKFNVKSGETVSVLGPSGCGKSTLIGILAGLLPRLTSHHIDGEVQLFGLQPKAYRENGRLSFMFQEPTLLPHLSVEKNVLLPLETLHGKTARNSKLAQDLINKVGLDGFESYIPRDLSGGMKTRVALARSFIVRPDILFMDEPFVGLDLGWKESLYSSFNELRLQNGTTTFMVTHDLEEAVYNSDRVFVMSRDGEQLKQIQIPGEFPRKFNFGETVSKYTEILSHLAGLLTEREKKEPGQ